MLTVKDALSISVYRNCLSLGYKVIDVRQLVSGRNVSALSSIIRTPYYFGGHILYGHTLVLLTDERPGGIRHADSVELWLTDDQGKLDRNILDVLSNDDFKVFTGTKDLVPSKYAYAELEQFAGAASELPHVFTFSEFIELRDLGVLDQVLNAQIYQDYQVYLDDVKYKMESGVEFVGRIETLEDLLKVNT